MFNLRVFKINGSNEFCLVAHPETLRALNLPVNTGVHVLEKCYKKSVRACVPSFLLRMKLLTQKDFLFVDVALDKRVSIDGFKSWDLRLMLKGVA
jgi:hypothetical protein